MREGITHSIESEQQKEEIEYPEIAELEQPIKTIFSSLRREIEAGGYSLVIGLDASGRLPALVIKSALEQIYEKKGFLKPETFFCAGFRTSSSDKVKSQKRAQLKELFVKFIERIHFNFDLNKKALIVEDSVNKGGSFGPVVVMLENMGIKADVVAMTMVHPPKQREEAEPSSSGKPSGLVVKVYIGGYGVPKIYDTPYLSGVIKHPSNVLATGFGVSVKRKYESLKNKPNPTKKDQRDLKSMNKNAGGDIGAFFKHIQEEGINVARKDAKLVADRVAQDFLLTSK